MKSILYLLIGVGFMNIFWGLISYKKNNRTNAAIMILIGFLILVIAALKMI